MASRTVQPSPTMRFSCRLLIQLLFALFSTFVFAASVTASAPPEPETPATTEPPPDPLGRGTPRSSVLSLIDTLAEMDYERAAQFFDLPISSGARQRAGATAHVQHFHSLLDNGGSLKPFAALSNDASGRVDDDLPVDQENVGEVVVQGTTVPIVLTRGKEGEHQVWRVSRATVNQIAAARPPVPAAQNKEQQSFVIAGAPARDWALLIGLGALIFGGLWMASALVVAAMRRMVAQPAANGIYRFIEAAVPPLSLLVAVGVFYNWAEQLPVSIVARQTLLRYTGAVAVVAVVWFGLRLVDAIAELVIARMQRHQRRQVISIVTLLRRTVKVLLLTFSAIGILDTFGIDVTTGIAALGIGSIALALGAQKTVENLVGSVTVIADRPLQVGDFVKVGDVLGTVEDLGIRSTRIRTGERSLVSIPNGDLSSRQIENFAPRDRFLFNPVVAVSYGTSSAKLKEAIAIVQQVLADETRLAEGHRARLGNIGERSFNIEVWAYIDVREFDTQVIIREELLLSIYERLEAAGIALAFPAQTIVLSPEPRTAGSRELTAPANRS